MSGSTSYPKPTIVVTFVLGIIIGGLAAAIIDWSALPSDKAEAANQIRGLQSSLNEETTKLTEKSKQVQDLQNQLAAAQRDTNAARQEATEAKAAKPDRYKIVKEGIRTWRLDSATGQMCLLLTTEADWKKPESQMSSCENAK